MRTLAANDAAAGKTNRVQNVETPGTGFSLCEVTNPQQVFRLLRRRELDGARDVRALEPAALRRDADVAVDEEEHVQPELRAEADREPDVLIEPLILYVE